MTPAQRVTQLARWHESVRLTIGRSPVDAARLETLEQELIDALADATREHEAHLAVDAHIQKALGGT